MQSQVLKVLADEDRAKLAQLELVSIDMPADGLAARHFVELSQLTNRERSIRINGLAQEDSLLYEDYSAMEGITREQRIRFAHRDRHLVTILKQITPLKCTICRYDPIGRGATRAQARAILEAHHKVPVRAGERLSRVTDLTLLCPNCHREVHQGISSVPNSV